MTIHHPQMALVADLMSSPVITVTTATPVSDAMKILRDHRIRHLPVVNARGRLVGVVSNRNMLVAHRSRGDIGGTRRIGHVMTNRPYTIRPHDALALAADRLLKHKIGCLPVVDEDGQVVGIIAESDFVKAFATHRDSVPVGA
jgi:CBS domain-containing protein